MLPDQRQRPTAAGLDDRVMAPHQGAPPRPRLSWPLPRAGIERGLSDQRRRGHAWTFDGAGRLTGSSGAPCRPPHTLGQTTAATNGGVTLSGMAYAEVGQTERTSYTQGSTTTGVFTTPLGVDKTTTGVGSTAP